MASLSDRLTHLSGELSDLAVRLIHMTDLDQLNLLSGTTDEVLARYYEARETTQREAREMPTFKVFVSSTYIDLKDHRRAVIDSLLRLKLQPVAMEFFGAKPEEPRQVCDNEIRGCDLFVGIYAHRYGFVPEEGEKSITEQEFDLAQELGKPCFCYLMDEDHPWPPKFIEDEPGKSRLRAFKARIESALVRDTFATPQELAGRVASDLGKWLAEHGAPIPSTPTIYHNLPQPDYGTFVGREAELARIRELLSPDSRHFLVTVDGIGGIGKSALALETAHRYLREYDKLPEEEQFEAIIWTSAKSSVLTADGIAPRQQITRTLDDIYTTIAVTLERGDITRARPEDQDELVTKALTQQRTLLIVDNLETIDDERVSAFLRELPAPTKAIVTTRHRIDVAYPVRLTGMPREDGLALIAQECDKKGVTLTETEAEKLYDRTGGVPLAIVWSVAQMGYGYEVEAVLRRLGQPTSDIARFCFEGVVERIRGRPAHKLLMALSLFVPDASREALGCVANLSELDRDEGLVELQVLSLANKQQDRFALLPLTKSFASAELDRSPHFKDKASRKWVDYLKGLYQVADGEYYWRLRSYRFHKEGSSIIEAIHWAYEHGTADDVFLLTLAANEYLDAIGDWKRDIGLCRRALRLARSIQNPIAIAHFARIESWLLTAWGEYQEAKSRVLEALKQYQQIGNREGECITLQNLSRIYRKTRVLEKAREACDQAWSIAEDLDEGDLKALINSEYGRLARDIRDWESAWQHFMAVKNWFEERVEQAPRDEMLARSTWGQLAIVAYHLGRPREAKNLCLKSLEFFETGGMKSYLSTLKYRLALAEEALGEYEAALEHAREAVEWFDRLGMKPNYIEAKALLERLEQQI